VTVGTVHLVGAGPGDPDLLTLKAARLIETADVVLVDSLVSGAIRERIDPGRIVDVGKKSGDGGRTTQAEINEHLVREARAGREVVRLKGGDPFVFGRGGEEIEYLATHDVPFEIVPGVTSAIGVPGNAGVPLTHRDHASAVTVVTGHEDPTKGESALDWDALSSTVTAGGTLVILMGVGRLPDNVAALRAEGVPGDTPAGMIERGTCEGEAAVTATLDSIVEQARGEEIEPPAVTVVGDVVAVRDAVLPWLDGSTPTRPTVTAEDGERGVPGHSGD
jgi:uroporphyrin-III C-methyltransferase